MSARRATLFGLKGVLLAALWGLVGCETVATQDLSRFVEVVPASHSAAGPQRKPFVVFLQGTGGANLRAEMWTTWFNAHGVSTVIVDNARLRGRNDLNGVDSHYLSKDISLALAHLQTRTDLDFQRYAVMGFSRGGTAALQAGGTLKAEEPRPQFVFALYPGGAGQCPNTYTETTRVLVFYGEDDASGTRNGNRERCRRMAETSANGAYHGFAGTHHAYDVMGSGVDNDGAGAYLMKHNPMAVEETRRIILGEMLKKWPDAVK